MEVTAISGNHKEGKTNEDVKFVIFEEQSMLFPLIGLGKMFPNINTLRIINSGLKFVRKDDFRNLEKLKIVDFYNNILEKLSEDVFEDLYLIEELNLPNNKLYELPENIFRNLKNLHTIDLSKNKLESLPENIFKFNLKLRSISLTSNSIMNIPQYTFAHLNITFFQAGDNYCILEGYSIIFIENREKIMKKLEADIKSCNHTCPVLTKQLSKVVKESSECEKEFDVVNQRNLKIRNQQKACFFL